MGKVILHVLNLNVPQLSIPIIESFAELSRGIGILQEVVLYGRCNSSLKHKYEIELKNSRLEFRYVTNLVDLFFILKKRTESICLLHGLSYDVMLCVLMSGIDTNWICWGAGSSINKDNIKSVLFTPVKKYIYKRFKTIVVLMYGDRLSLECDFGVKNVSVLPYYSHRNNIYRGFYVDLKKVNIDTYNHKGKKKILLGNSAHNINGYYELLYKLARFKDNIEVHCMMQYPRLKQEEMDRFIERSFEILGAHVQIDTDMMDYTQYVQYINQCDIYMCSNKNQSGLGAIYSCLMLGKKVYLAGKNLEWISSLGYKVFNTKSLDSMTENIFFEDLSQELQDKHFNMRYEEQFAHKRQWVEYLKSLSIY